MADFEQFMIDICTEHEWTWDKEGDAIIFQVPFSDGRHQTCSALIVSSSWGPLVEVRSIVGKKAEYDPANYKDLLVFNNEKMAYGRVVISDNEEYIMVVARSLADSADKEEIEVMIKEASAYADILELRYYNRDEE